MSWVRASSNECHAGRAGPAQIKVSAGREAGEFGGVGGSGDDVANSASIQTVAKFFGAEQSGGRNHDRTELTGCQKRFPELDFIAEHQQNAIATLDAEGAEVIGDLVGSLRQLGEGEAGFRSRLIDDP